MEKAIKVWTVEKGQVKEIEMDGMVFTVKPKVFPLETRMINTTNKGKRLGNRSHVAIYENIANEMKHERFYPNYQPVSTRTTATAYRAYLKYGLTEDPYKTKTTQKLQGIVYKRHHHKKPEDAVAFVKTYQTWVKQNWIDRVKVAISRFGIGYNPNVETIMQETGLKRTSVLSTLKYLKQIGEIKKVYDETRGLIYQPVIRLENITS